MSESGLKPVSDWKSGSSSPQSDAKWLPTTNEIMNKTKVLYLVEEPKLGGPQVQMARVAAALSGSVDVKLLIPDGDNALFCQLCDDLGLDYDIVQVSGLTREARPLTRYFIRSPFEIAGLVRHIRRERPDIIHAWGGSWQFKAAIVSKLTGVPLVWLLNDTGIPSYIHRIFQFLAKQGASFIFASQKTGDYYGSILPVEAKKTVIQSMVDLDDFDPERSYPGDEDLIASFGDDFVVGVIANVSPVKGLETFVRVAARAKEAGNNCRFIIVGQTFKRQGKLRGNLLALAAQLGLNNLHFAGARKDVRPLLHRFDAYLCSSLSESSPVAVWEAMAMGCPVVSTRVGDVPIFVKDGQNGYLAAVGDDAALWEGIERLASDPALASALSKSARETACEVFGREHIAEQTHAFYHEVLSEKDDDS